jgi:hypothetical protein
MFPPPSQIAFARRHVCAVFIVVYIFGKGNEKSQVNDGKSLITLDEVDPE